MAWSILWRRTGWPCSENIFNDLWECSFTRMSGIQRFTELKDGESDEEMQRKGRQKKKLKILMWKRGDKKTENNQWKNNRYPLYLPLKLRQYLCMFKVKKNKDCGDRGLEILKMKLESMATCIVNVRMLFYQNPRRDRDNWQMPTFSSKKGKIITDEN